MLSAQFIKGLGLTDIKLGGARTQSTGMQPNIGKTEGIGEGFLMMIGNSWLTDTPTKEKCNWCE